jgi:hypothetical protein
MRNKDAEQTKDAEQRMRNRRINPTNLSGDRQRVAASQWPHLSGITKLREIFQLPSAWFCHTVK